MTLWDSTRCYWGGSPIDSFLPSLPKTHLVVCNIRTSTIYMYMYNLMVYCLHIIYVTEHEKIAPVFQFENLLKMAHKNF